MLLLLLTADWSDAALAEEGVYVRQTLAALLHLAQSQAVGTVTHGVASFPLGTQGLSGKALQCCATDSFLPRKGKRDRYGVKFPQSCSASPFRAAAWLPRSASGTSLAVNVCFSALLAVGCPLPWLQGERGDALPVPPNRERGRALPMGCFCWL